MERKNHLTRLAAIAAGTAALALSAPVVATALVSSGALDKARGVTEEVVNDEGAVNATSCPRCFVRVGPTTWLPAAPAPDVVAN